MDPTPRELLWLRRVHDLSRLLVSETDLAALLPRILAAAVEIAEAERGFMVRLLSSGPGEPGFSVEAAHGFSRADLAGAAREVSRSALARVVATGRGLVTTVAADADLLAASSVQARQVLAMICVPMRRREELWGVLYLDDRRREDAFREDDVPLLETFADQAALAVETAELRTSQARLGETLREIERLRAEAALAYVPPTYAPRFGRLVGGSPPMLALYAQVERAARGRDPLLIRGESGVGKALVAQEVHARSELAAQPFVELDLLATAPAEHAACLQDALSRAGRGTLALTGIEGLERGGQGRLVSLLKARPDCRVIAITRADLRSLVGTGALREDLFHRLDVERIEVPPLRERRGDVPVLLDWLTPGDRRPSFAPDALELLESYAWPGNVRELQNEVRRLRGLDTRTLRAQHLSPEIRAGAGVAGAPGALSGKTMSDVERTLVEAALRDTQGNIARAARRLGIPRSTLYGLMDRYGLR